DHPHSHIYTLSLYDALPISPTCNLKCMGCCLVYNLDVRWSQEMATDVSMNLTKPAPVHLRSRSRGIRIHLVFFAFTIVTVIVTRSEEHTSELQSQSNLVCRL